MSSEATLHLHGWAGHTAQAVVIVRETPTRYRIRAARGGIVKLAGRNRWITGEQTALVPKDAITLALLETVPRSTQRTEAGDRLA